MNLAGNLFLIVCVALRIDILKGLRHHHQVLRIQVLGTYAEDVLYGRYLLSDGLLLVCGQCHVLCQRLDNQVEERHRLLVVRCPAQQSLYQCHDRLPYAAVRYGLADALQVLGEQEHRGYLVQLHQRHHSTLHAHQGGIDFSLCAGVHTVCYFLCQGVQPLRGNFPMTAE